MKVDGHTSDWIKHRKDGALAGLQNVAPPEMEDMGNAAIQAGVAAAQQIAAKSAAEATATLSAALGQDENKVQNKAWGAY
ncbi:MAG: hypothetical protein FJZ01_13010 [Candidatus Sericytochromatia bacterium]|nr:hypothetical protein [Candidatus Tanganyikabacteria bacterium]